MHPINFKKNVTGSLDEVIVRVSEALLREGFGILTRIDLQQKFKEKLGKDIAPAVILGACNPQLAYDAYKVNPDVSSLIPCNVVIREILPSEMSVEIASPSAIMQILGDSSITEMAKEADSKLRHVLDQLPPGQAA